MFLRKQVYIDNFYGFLFAAPWLIGCLAFKIGPLCASLYYSFTQYEVLTPPRWIGLENYKALFSDSLFYKSIFNTVYYVALSVPLQIIVALCLAMLLKRERFGTNLFRTIFYVPSVVSGVTLAMIWLWMFNPDFGLINNVLGILGLAEPAWLADPAWAKPALVLMSLWGVGTNMVIYIAALQGVPQELYEAAVIDGSSAFHSFWKITLPMISSVIFFTLVTGIIGSFQVFTQAYVMTQGGPANATLFYVMYLYQQAFVYFKMGYASSLAWVLFVIVLIITVIQFRFADRWVYYESQGREA
jgi:multiple sugar transport system permease protein